MKRIVISGIGVQVPEGYQEKIQNKGEGYLEIPMGDEVFQVIDRKTRKRIDRYIQLGMIASTKALTESGVLLDEDEAHKGIIAASTFGSVTTITEDVQTYCDTGHISPLFIPKVVMNMFAGNLAIAFGVKGVNYTIGSGFNSSMDALVDALELLEEGRTNSVLVCAAESCLGPYGKKLFQGYKKNEFYEDASCYVEGACAVVLEPLESALERNAHIYAEVTGYDSIYKKGNQKEERLSKLLEGKKILGAANACGYGVAGSEDFQVLESSDNYFGATHPMIYVNDVVQKMENHELKEATIYSMNPEGVNTMVSICKFEQ